MFKYLLLLLGFLLLIKGADLFVEGSSSIARLLRIPSIIIGLTVVAFGTSMPEASVSITAALSGKNDLSLSNVVGSNIFNLLVVVGVSAAIYPMKVQPSVLKKDLPFSILISGALLLMCIPSAYRGMRVSILSRTEGIVLLAAFFHLCGIYSPGGAESQTDRRTRRRPRRTGTRRKTDPPHPPLHRSGHGGDRPRR